MGRDAWGVPISAAHMGYAITFFTTRARRHTEAQGARYDSEERAGAIHPSLAPHTESPQ